MSFIAKNPLALPEVGAPSSLPAGTRGLFAGKDGFYQIDSDNNISKIATVEYVTEILSEIETYNEYGDDITEYFDFDSYTADGVYKIYERQRSDDTVSNHYILCVDTSSYDDVRQTLICLSNGEIKQRMYYGEWEKVSVSQADLNKYVSKENGKGLSTNDFTDKLKNKLETMSEGGEDLTVDSELSETSENPVQNKVITSALYTKADSSLAFDGYYYVDGYNADYNERLYKAENGFVIQSVSSYSESGSYYGVEQYWYTEGEVYYRHLGDEGGWENEWQKVSVSQNDIKNKVDKVKGKGLSTEDFTTALKNKLEAIPEGGANITVDSKLSTTSTNPVQNKVITAELNASIKMSEYVDLYDNIVEYFNGKTGFGAEFVQYDQDGGATEPQTLIFTWGAFQEGDEDFDYQTVISPKGEIYHRTKNYNEEWITPEDQTNFWNECGWGKISVSQADLKATDKVPALKMNPAIEIKSGSGYLNWTELTEMDVPDGVSIIYSVDNISASTYEYGLLIKSYGDYEQLVVILPNGEIREIHRDYDTGEWLEWISPYVTPTDLDNAIGDIETSLENKVDKEEGKGLSTNDFTDELKAKVESSGNVDLSGYITQDIFNETIGDIETTLDNIIAIQNQLIGSNSINIVQDDIILKDNTTNTNYKVYVSDGELTMSLESGVE